LHLKHSVILKINENPVLAELIIRKRMVAVQGDNTADVDDYQLKTSTFYEMSTYTLQKESNEATVQYVGVVLPP
jgi:hypothetical protein